MSQLNKPIVNNCYMKIYSYNKKRKMRVLSTYEENYANSGIGNIGHGSSTNGNNHHDYNSSNAYRDSVGRDEHKGGRMEEEIIMISVTYVPRLDMYHLFAIH